MRAERIVGSVEAAVRGAVQVSRSALNLLEGYARRRPGRRVNGGGP